MDYLCPCGITVVIRDRYWIEKQRMYAFLTMAQGSCEPPYFVEMAYCGGSPDDKPIVLAGNFSVLFFTYIVLRFVYSRMCFKFPIHYSK